METAYYHVKDPLENFKLRVIVREISRIVSVEKDIKNEEIFHEDLNISWQEKISGPDDIVKNLSVDIPNVSSE